MKQRRQLEQVAGIVRDVGQSILSGADDNTDVDADENEIENENENENQPPFESIRHGETHRPEGGDGPREGRNRPAAMLDRR